MEINGAIKNNPQRECDTKYTRKNKESLERDTQ